MYTCLRPDLEAVYSCVSKSLSVLKLNESGIKISASVDAHIFICQMVRVHRTTLILYCSSFSSSSRSRRTCPRSWLKPWIREQRQNKKLRGWPERRGLRGLNKFYFLVYSLPYGTERNRGVMNEKEKEYRNKRNGIEMGLPGVYRIFVHTRRDRWGWGLDL